MVQTFVVFADDSLTTTIKTPESFNSLVCTALCRILSQEKNCENLFWSPLVAFSRKFALAKISPYTVQPSYASAPLSHMVITLISLLFILQHITKFVKIKLSIWRTVACTNVSLFRHCYPRLHLQV